MIISVSRRTDIPAFYSEWFFNRLKEGYVLVQNPMNTKQISRLELNKNTVDCFVFWTKNAKPMLKRLDELKEYKYYFQYTITGYNKEVEIGLGNKKDIINNFRELSKVIGREKVILRYDPIFLSDKYTIDYHCKAFDKLCSELQGYTDKCVISFLDLYTKTKKNTKGLNIIPFTLDTIYEVAYRLSLIAKKYNISIETCSEGYNLQKFGIKKGKCIDDRLVSQIIGYKVNVKKDETQREVCGCVKSIDIGQYNTCKHHCLYCYANYSYSQVEGNCKKHNPNNPLLVGEVPVNAKITNRQLKSIKGDSICIKQINLLDDINL